MVKKLFLLRHAQASETEAGGKDVERYLTRTGQREAVHVGSYLKNKSAIPDLIITSIAERARMTAQVVAEQLAYPLGEVLEDPEIYEASVRTFLRSINELDVNCQQVMYVGHNPTISYLAELLTGEVVGSIEPGGVVEIHFSKDSWKEVSQHTGTLVSYKTPTQIEQEGHG